MIKKIYLLLICAGAFMLSGCSTMMTRDRVAVPKELTDHAEIPGDRNYMQALYDFAYKSIADGDPWLRNLD